MTTHTAVPTTAARRLAPLLFVLLTGLIAAGCHGRLPRPGKPVATAVPPHWTAAPPGSRQRGIELTARARLFLEW